MVGYVYLVRKFWWDREVYVGSTFNFKQRCNHHRHRFNTWNTRFTILEQHDWMEGDNPQHRFQLRQIEQQYIQAWDSIENGWNKKDEVRKEDRMCSPMPQG
jgi:hypothetical protein